jgi:sugar-specific transcriptional regulator TrmB/DNA-binding CsgD family transcriptional regulator
VLAALGLDEDEDVVYGHLAGVVSASAEEVSGALGMSADRTFAALRRLVDRGFAHRLSDVGPARYTAASPDTIAELITQHLGELHRAQESLGRIAARYRAQQRALDGGGLFEVIRGSDTLGQQTKNMVRTARFEVLNMVKPPIIALRSRERVQPSESVRNRVIFETEALDAPGAIDAIRQGARPQDEVRVHTKLPVKMLAIDRSVALVPVAQADSTPVGVLIHESAVLDAFLSLFDYVWATSVRLHVGGGNGTGPLGAADRHLLSLLLSGLTDEAIAVHLHVSERTVQRRVRSLMESASVRTRMQLAWEAARQGWV